ncbi:PAS domain S-box protein [Pendulispora brunnea]|uniref:PAS domain S-box protein n=1 Tax=Pendulispora brunnea TaxID=2905690 RepID=UPI00374E0510
MSSRPVLVVDDDTVSRHVLCQALTQAELRHVAVGSGTEALQKIREVDPCIVVLDLVMPPPDGYEILGHLRAQPETRDLPVVVLTALDADNEIARAFEAGADDFVRKPFKPVELVARIRGQLRLRAVMEELARKEKDAQVVLELTQALASNLDFRGILFTVVQRIAEVAKVDRVSIVLVSEQADLGYVVAASDNAELRDLPIDLSKYPEIRQVLDNGEPLVITDAETHPLLEIVRHGARAHAGARAFASIAILPILYEGRPMGVLFVRSKSTFAFGEHELALCKTVSNAMAIALRNARVLQSLRDQTQKVNVARFEAERRLRSLQRYADFFESSADGIVVIDSEGRLLFSNPKAREITGYSETDFRGRRLGDMFDETDIAKARELRDGFAQGHFPRGVDVRIRNKEGQQATLSINFNSVLREEGVVLCSFRDVTHERTVEADLVKTRDFLRRIIDTSGDAIISADMQGRVLVFNNAAERIYGRPTREVIGSDVRELYPPGVARNIMRMIREGGGRIEGVRTEVLDREKNRVPVALSAAFLYEQETLVGSVGIFTDLREKVRMEQRLAQAQEQLLAQERQAIVAELAGAAAHELNQPLTSVMAYAELIKRRLDAESPVFAAVDVIFNEAERMAEIVRKIGKITRYETKAYVGQAKILDLDKASDEGEDNNVAAALGKAGD